ncbi:AraC-like DNA-binding protein [Parabacteroides sp. PFB2-12]|nr:AraC-like DNA-binding protein [Parabacteroides sp. PM6-13]MDH6391590.1 AraC-like DNA-binding protein [Parabacteroides sp. PFB2-12]
MIFQSVKRYEFVIFTTNLNSLDLSTFIVVTSIWLVVICSLACAIYMLLLLTERYSPYERRMQKGALVYFLFFTGICLSRLFYKWYPELFVYFAPLLYLCHTGSGVAFYYICFAFTSPRNEKRFPLIHYLLPPLIPVILGVWMLFVPFDVPLGIVKGFRALNPEWPIFSRVFASFIPAQVLFIGVYLFLSMKKLRHYRKSLPEKKWKEIHYRLRSIYAIIAILFVGWLHPLLVLFTSIENAFFAYGAIVPIALSIPFVEIVLVNNLQRHNYPRIEIIPAPKPKSPPSEKVSEPAPMEPVATSLLTNNTSLNLLSRKDFDNYFRQEKPYLNTELRLTTLADQLGVGREELSKFINRTYGMNFNSFVGRWRFREMERLRKLAKNKEATIKSLLPQAGFANYNSYMRARQEAERKKNEKEKPPHQD